MELLPAVLIGGPPHSGKSVLTYSLTQAFRQGSVEHYVLRAAPDGEGDWANEADQKLVRTIRIKGPFTSEFVDHICDGLARRHLPLLVDVGGRPTPYQERIFDFCTHAILLTRDESSRSCWRAMMERHNLPIVADLTSRLEGVSHVSAKAPVVRGVIVGLERGKTAAGPVFDALVERLGAILCYDTDELRRIHLAMAPVETVVVLDKLARRYDVPSVGAKAVWEPCHLEAILEYLPERVPLGLYGRGPNWLYAAVALHPFPEPFYQFDPRLGWVSSRPLRLGQPAPEASLQARVSKQPDHTWIEFHIPTAHLDYDEALGLTVPEPLPGLGVVLSGKLPHWLYTALTLTYAPHVPWLAVYQPPLDHAVVVSPTDVAPALGDLIEPPSAKTV